MTDETARTPENAPAEGENAGSVQPPQSPAEVALLAALDIAQREAAEYKDKALRTLAEMENLRRRTEREVADARTYAITGFARDVLQVADNMHRALEVVDAGERAKADAAISSLIEGVELTERELLKSLEKNGVRKFSPEGQKFDPNVHQAMFEVPGATVPPGHVAQVIQDGYMIGERVLRPALVGVSKAAPKPAASAAGDAQANSSQA